MQHYRIFFFLAWVIVVSIGAWLWFALTPAVHAARDIPACGASSLFCWPAAEPLAKAHLARLQVPPVEGVQVINPRDERVDLAWGWFEPGATSRPIGDFLLPVVREDLWVAQGWTAVSPLAAQTFTPPAPGAELYVRLEANGNSIVPAGHTGVKDFCIASQSFRSQMHAGETWFVIEVSDRGAVSGESCLTAGGEWRTFYKLPVTAPLILE